MNNIKKKSYSKNLSMTSKKKKSMMMRALKVNTKVKMKARKRRLTKMIKNLNNNY